MSSRLAAAYGLRSGFGRDGWLLALGTLLVGGSRGLVGPFIVLFLVEERGLSLATVGAGITLEFLLRAAAGPVAGALSDRVGRKPLMAVGLASTVAILPAYLLVETPAHFYALSVANGLLAAHSLYGPAASALVTDLLPAERRGAMFGLVHASRNLGFTVGVGVGILLARGAIAPLFVAAAGLPLLFLVLVLPALRAPPPPRTPARRKPWHDWRALLATPAFVAFLALSPVLYLGWGQASTIFPLFVSEGLGLGRAAVALLAINGALIVLLQIPFGRVADGASRPRLLALAALALAASYLAYAAATVAPHVWAVSALVGGLLLFTLAELIYTPVLAAYAADLAPPGAVGSALGLAAFAQAIGIGAPPLLAEWLLPRGGWIAVWLGLAALCVPCAWAFARQRAAHPPAIPEP